MLKKIKVSSFSDMTDHDEKERAIKAVRTYLTSSSSPDYLKWEEEEKHFLDGRGICDAVFERDKGEKYISISERKLAVTYICEDFLSYTDIPDILLMEDAALPVYEAPALWEHRMRDYVRTQVKALPADLFACRQGNHSVDWGRVMAFVQNKPEIQKNHLFQFLQYFEKLISILQLKVQVHYSVWFEHVTSPEYVMEQMHRFYFITPDMCVPKCNFID